MTNRLRSTDKNDLIDPKSPWEVTLRGWDWQYTYRASATQWHRLLVRAQRGDSKAQWEVGDRYSEGCKDKEGNILVKRSRKKATEWFRRAAQHGFAPAQNALGVLLSDKDADRRRMGEAFSWLRKAFYAGDSCAAQNIAVTYRQVGELRRAVEWFKRSATARDADALVQLGLHYYWGRGIKKNPSRAVGYFRRAVRTKNISQAGKEDAFFFLGVAYLQGQGVRASIRAARKFLERANIDNDHAAARHMLRQLQT